MTSIALIAISKYSGSSTASEGEWLFSDQTEAANLIPSPNPTAWSDGQNVPDFNTSATTAPTLTTLPTQLKYYGSVYSCNFRVDRDYAGINSSGGPQVAGRADYQFPVITRGSDEMSPFLFQSAWSGWQLKHVYLVFPMYSGTDIEGFELEIIMSGVNVTKFKFVGAKGGRTKYSIPDKLNVTTGVRATPGPPAIPAIPGTLDLASQLSSFTQTDVSMSRSDNPARYEQVSFNYTTIAFRWGKGGHTHEWHGWNTGTNNIV